MVKNHIEISGRSREELLQNFLHTLASIGNDSDEVYYNCVIKVGDSEATALTNEQLMEKCLQLIVNDVLTTEVSQGRIAMREAARRAKVLAEKTLLRVRLRRAGGDNGS
jgi:hypothetical protein